MPGVTGYIKCVGVGGAGQSCKNIFKFQYPAESKVTETTKFQEGRERDPTCLKPVVAAAFRKHNLPPSISMGLGSQEALSPLR